MKPFARVRTVVSVCVVIAVALAPFVLPHLSCASTGVLPNLPPSVSGATPVFGYRVVRTYPHDKSAFTQGLVFDEGVLYESTGLNGRSSLRRVELESGRVLQKRDIDARYFAEGLAVIGERLIQLTWQSHTGFLWDKRTFEPRGEFKYSNEGWGLAFDGTSLIQSDGTARLTFLDPLSHLRIHTLDVKDERGPVLELNELECVEGEILANVWQTDRIARIEPSTGRVLGWIDLRGLLSAEERRAGADWLNGIAFDAGAKRLFVTGKLWPKLFEIEVLAPR